MSDAQTDIRDQVAAGYDHAADELEQAARHLRIAARHYRDREIPRGCAHAWAAHGNMQNARHAMTANAIIHAGKAST